MDIYVYMVFCKQTKPLPDTITVSSKDFVVQPVSVWGPRDEAEHRHLNHNTGQ